MFIGANVEVHDNLFAEELRSKLLEAVSWLPVYFLNRMERYKSHKLDIHWYYPIAFSDGESANDVEAELRTIDDALQPIVQCWDVIKANTPHPVRLYECMLAANIFGTGDLVHQDIVDPMERPRHRTALVYCNKEWNADWAGETLVYDDSGEISGAVMPRPGRVMTISGDPMHVGRSVSRICPSDRRVLVFKYWALD